MKKIKLKGLRAKLTDLAMRSTDLEQIKDIKFAILSGDAANMLRELNREKYGR